LPILIKEKKNFLFLEIEIIRHRNVSFCDICTEERKPAEISSVYASLNGRTKHMNV